MTTLDGNLQGVINEMWQILIEVSDEVGEQEVGHGYLLKYEGWGGFCVESVWSEVQKRQEQQGVDIDSSAAIAEREEACYEYAREQTDMIIEDEWKTELEERGYNFVDGGYDDGGLYGRCWALFKER
jgi:hypothetical protein